MTRRFAADLLFLALISGAACRAADKPSASVEARRSALVCSQPPLSITAGYWHNCALLPDHTVECWGTNYRGQLGDGTTSMSTVPRPVPGLTNVSAVSAGVSTTCALLANGHVSCWGTVLGAATSASLTSPVEVAGLSDVAAISVGGDTACALLSAGTVKCWGYNAQGTVGDGTTTDRTSPVTVVGVSGARQIAVGQTHACALIAGGGVKCWGSNATGECGDGTFDDRSLPGDVLDLPPAAQIDAGSYFTCAVLMDGTARCWGYSRDGALGDGTTTPWSFTPLVVQGLSGAVEISTGDSHACARLASGDVRCWGYNFQGQVGDGTTSPSRAPAGPVPGLGGPAMQISVGSMHSCAVTANGIHCWGIDDTGELGNGSSTDAFTPVPATGLGFGVTQISAGFTEACALRSDGGVRCWGENSNGGLGVGTTAGSPTPLAVTGLPGPAAQVSAGRSRHACARLADGSAWCWGYNVTGQIGDGTTTDQPSPVAVQGLGPIAEIGTGAFHTCARTTDGHVWCWGENYAGELGDPDIATTSPLPHQVPGLTGVMKIAVGYEYNCALNAGGSVSCWGSNDRGKLGDGTNVLRAIPTIVNLSGVSDVVAGNSHTCAVLLDGSLWCWGYNWAGQLGDGTTTDSFVPVRVAGLTDVVAVSLGEWHTCALTAGGAVSCWGHNSVGQLGDGTLTDARTPRVVPSLSGVAGIAAGGYFTCALLTGGGVECWGDNTWSELGNSVEPGIRTPVDVVCAPPAAETCTLPPENCGPVAAGDDVVGFLGWSDDVDVAQNPVGSVGLIFAGLAAEGTATVVEHPQDLSQPGEFTVVGPHYWSIETTATFSSLIVCVRYDDAWIAPGQEMLLQLLHRNAQTGQFENVTLAGFPDPNANVICGQVTSLSPFVLALPFAPDVTPPTFDSATDIIAYATSTKGAAVGYTPPRGTDDIDGAVPVTCTPASGSLFAPGKATVTCGAVDAAGNTATTSFTIWVQYQGPSGGTFFLPPLDTNDAHFRLGGNIQAKFKLLDASAGIRNLAARLFVAKVSNGVTGPYAPAESAPACEGGNQFRYEPLTRQYVFNLSTRKLTAGTWSLRADLGDLVDRSVEVVLR